MSTNYIEPVREDLAGRLPTCPPDLLELYALLVFTRGIETTLQDVHDAWSIWQTRTRPDHRSAIPFHLLSTAVQEMDRKYADAIIATASLWARR